MLSVNIFPVKFLYEVNILPIKKITHYTIYCQLNAVLLIVVSLGQSPHVLHVGLHLGYTCNYIIQKSNKGLIGDDMGINYKNNG